MSRFTTPAILEMLVRTQKKRVHFCTRQYGSQTEHSYKSPFLFHTQQIKNYEPLHNSRDS